MNERTGIALVVAAALVIRIAFAFALPPLQAPDEAAHFRYVTFLGEERAMPIHPGERSFDLFADPMAEAYQPPLAYASFVPVERGLAALDAPLRVRLRAVRLQNALYGALTVLLGSLVAMRLTRRGDPRRMLTAIVIAFLPGFVAAGAAVNNDSLANLLAAALWLALIPAAGGERSAWRSGLLFGAACLAKLSSLVLAPLLLVVPLLQDRSDLRGAVRFAAIAIGIAALMLLPWMGHNLVQYGSPLAIGVGSIPFDWLESVVPGAELEGFTRARYDNAFFQFWGRFGVANNLSWIGVPIVLVPIAGLAALGWLRRRASSEAADGFDAWAPVWLLAAALATAGLVQFSLTYVGAWQGRYLYSVMLPWALLFAGGISRALRFAASPDGAEPAAASPQAPWVIAALALAFVVVDVIVLVKLVAFFAEAPPGQWLLFTRL
jgi:hypothetical protein